MYPTNKEILEGLSVVNKKLESRVQLLENCIRYLIKTNPELEFKIKLFLNIKE